MAGEAEAGQLIGGTSSMPLSSVKANLKVDVTKLNTVKAAVDQLNASLAKTKSLMADISTASSRITKSVGTPGTTTPGTSIPGTSSKGSYLPAAASAPVAAPRSATASRLLSAGGVGGAGGGTPPPSYSYLTGMGGSFYGMQAAGNIVGSLTQAVDNRLSGNMAYALPADRLSLIQQQMTGMTQNQISNTQRQPLAKYKLGQGGINDLLSNQTRYGIDAQQQGAGYEALRAISGYSLSTSDLVGIQNQLTSPQVANRLFNLTGGFNFNGPGGTTKNLFGGIKQLANLQGLNDPNILKGAFEQGSRSRANMSNLGLDDATQTLVLQYAKDNQTYKQRGGKGDYDPSKASDRKLMGTEGNFATQAEETEKDTVQRDEQMYKRQADNYASLERSNQALINAMGSLEDKISGLLGAAASTSPWRKLGGGVLKGLGAGLTLAMPELAPVGIGAYLLGSAIGDAPVNPSNTTTATTSVSASPAAGGSDSSANDSGIRVPTYGGTKTLTQVKQMPSFQKMKPMIQERLLKAFREHPALGFGEGFRDPDTQKQLFLSRYRRTQENTGIFWDNSYWEHVSGAAAAPPGMSFHGIGLAADLVGDVPWFQGNAARFGLKTFANVNSEPWHVQPLEYPNSFSEYQKAYGGGAPAPADASATPTPTAPSPSSSATSPTSASLSPETVPRETASGSASMATVVATGRGIPNYNGLSISDILASALASRPMGTGQVGGYRASKSSSTVSNAPATSNAPSASPTATGSTSKQLTGEQVAQLAWNAGFRGQDLINVVAISQRESDWTPSAHTVNAKSRDDSYGLMQINMLGSLGPERMRQFGLTTADPLLDGQTNMNAAFKLYQDNGNSLSAWGGYKGQSDTYSTNVAEATKVVTNAGLAGRGDPMPMSGPSPTRAAGQVMQIHSQPQIHIPMQFSFTGVPATVDMRKIAQEMKSIVQTELELLEMRSS